MSHLDDNIREDYAKIYEQGIPVLAKRVSRLDPDLRGELKSNPAQFARYVLDCLNNHLYSKHKLVKIVEKSPYLSRRQKRKVKS